jgi:hypothetical protein
MPTPRVSAAATALPGSTNTDLKRLSIHELTVLYDAVALAADAFIGVLNQPRTKGGAHVAVEDELNRCNDLISEIVEEVKSRRPIEDCDAAMRLQLITRHYIIEFYRPADLIRFAADFDRGKTP